MDTEVDFLAVVEHRLIPARVRGEWARLRRKGLATVWAPASQDTSHVGHAGVGVFSLRGAPLSLPTFATAQFKRFFDCDRAVRCMLPLVCSGCCFGDLGVVAHEQPCLVVGDFNVEPTKIPCLAKGISAGLWVDLEAARAFASGQQPGVTCKRTWDSTGGSRRNFLVGCPRAAAAVSKCVVREDRWNLPHLAVRAHFEWVSRVSQPVQRTPLWPASWLPVLDKSRGSKSAEVQRVCGIYDDRLQFMTGDDALSLDEALGDGDVSHAWSIWSSTAEAALADAYQFSGGPVPDRGLVLGRGAFLQ